MSERTWKADLLHYVQQLDNHVRDLGRTIEELTSAVRTLTAAQPEGTRRPTELKVSACRARLQVEGVIVSCTVDGGLAHHSTNTATGQMIHKGTYNEARLGVRGIIVHNVSWT